MFWLIHQPENDCILNIPSLTAQICLPIKLCCVRNDEIFLVIWRRCKGACTWNSTCSCTCCLLSFQQLQISIRQQVQRNGITHLEINQKLTGSQFSLPHEKNNLPHAENTEDTHTFADRREYQDGPHCVPVWIVLQKFLDRNSPIA